MTRCHESVPLTDPVKQRAEELQTQGFGAVDALHLACAETARVHIFLTTDDRLLRVRVENPLVWLQETQP